MVICLKLMRNYKKNRHQKQAQGYSMSWQNYAKIPKNSKVGHTKKCATRSPNDRKTQSIMEGSKKISPKHHPTSLRNDIKRKNQQSQTGEKGETVEKRGRTGNFPNKPQRKDQTPRKDHATRQKNENARKQYRNVHIYMRGQNPRSAWENKTDAQYAESPEHLPPG